MYYQILDLNELETTTDLLLKRLENRSWVIENQQEATGSDRDLLVLQETIEGADKEIKELSEYEHSNIPYEVKNVLILVGLNELLNYVVKENKTILTNRFYSVQHEWNLDFNRFKSRINDIEKEYVTITDKLKNVVDTNLYFYMVACELAAKEIGFKISRMSDKSTVLYVSTILIKLEDILREFKETYILS